MQKWMNAIVPWLFFTLLFFVWCRGHESNMSKWKHKMKDMQNYGPRQLVFFFFCFFWMIAAQSSQICSQSYPDVFQKYTVLVLYPPPHSHTHTNTCCCTKADRRCYAVMMLVLNHPPPPHLALPVSRDTHPGPRLLLFHQSTQVEKHFIC